MTKADTVPSSCGMGLSGCQTLIGAWAVGANGECSHKDVGFRIGQNGFKYAMMQVGVGAIRPLLFSTTKDNKVERNHDVDYSWSLPLCI